MGSLLARCRSAAVLGKDVVGERRDALGGRMGERSDSSPSAARPEPGLDRGERGPTTTSLLAQLSVHALGEVQDRVIDPVWSNVEGKVVRWRYVRPSLRGILVEYVCWRA